MDYIDVMEWIGTAAFAISGAMVAIKKGLDYYGIIVLAIVTAIGGGIVRDVLINRDLPASLENPSYVLISIASGILVIIFYRYAEKIKNIVNIADAIGLAAFVAVGCDVAVTESKGTVFVIITMAVLTGTGGGILRDIFAQEIPVSFRKEVYAVAAIAGAAVYAAIYKTFGLNIAGQTAFAVTLAIRLIAIGKGWQLGKVKIQKKEDAED